MSGSKRYDRQRGFGTYILTNTKMRWKCKNHHRETTFGLALQKALTGRRVLKRMLIADSWLWCWYVCFKSPVPVEGFSKPLSLWRVSDCWASMYVCVWWASRAERFGISGSSTVSSLTNLGKIQLNVKYWNVSVRNRTSYLEHEFPQTYIPARQTYIPAQQTYIPARQTYIHTWRTYTRTDGTRTRTWSSGSIVPI